MTHNTGKTLARTRARYTGENYQQAREALKGIGPGAERLPSACNEAQRRLEATILLALVRHGTSSDPGAPGGTRWWPGETPLTIVGVRPMADGLDLRIPEELLLAFCWCLLPYGLSSSDGQASRPMQWLNTKPIRSGIRLYRPDQSAGVTVRGCSAALWREAVHGASARSREEEIDDEPRRRRLNPRWARDAAECFDPAGSLIASQLLRRAALFRDPEAAEWIMSWQARRLPGGQNVLEWPPDPVPPALSRALRHRLFGVRVEKPNQLPAKRDPVDNDPYYDPRFWDGPLLDDPPGKRRPEPGSLLAGQGPPAPNRPTVVRPRLLDAIQGRFDRRVTALVAMPGLGKTTLLAHAMEKNLMSPRGYDVWVDCSADHAAVSVLASDLLSGLDPAPSTTDVPADPGLAARLVADAVWSRAPEQVALMLDGVQAMAPGSPGHRMLSTLVDVLPINGHLVLASRPPLSVPLTRLLATGSARLLNDAELVFDERELADFARLRGIDATVFDGVGGWPALAELAATVGRRYIPDYPWEEALASIPADRQAVLTVMASVGGADNTLASHLLNRRTELQTLLDGLPLVSSNSEGWWSLHPLWETVLLSRADPATVADARLRAAAALHRRGLPRESMRLLLEVEAWDDVRDLAVEVCSGVTPAVHADVLAQWLDRLPDPIRQTPEGLLLAGTASEGEDPLTAQRLLRDAAAGFRAEGRVAPELSCLESLFHIAYWGNDNDGMQQIMDRWGALAAGGDAEAELAARLGRALRATDPAQAAAELEQAPTSTSGPVGPIADWLRAHILLLTLGDAERAASWARQALQRAPSKLRSSIRCELVESLRLQGRLADAEAEVETLLDEAGAGVVRSPRHLAVAIVLSACLGRTERIEQLLPELRACTDASHLPWAFIAGRVGEAAAAVAAGQDERAAELLREALDHHLAQPWALLRICPATLSLYYMLVPEFRPAWDGADLRGVFRTAYRLARALAAIRENRSDENSLGIDSDDLALAPAYLPAPWAAELGRYVAPGPAA
jgi:hypothetical protein